MGEQGVRDPVTGSARQELDGAEERPDAQALRRKVAQLLLDTTNECIWLIDAQARTTFVNRHAAELLGYAEDEMVGKHIYEFLEESRRPLAQESLMRRQRGVEERQEVRLRRKDGTLVWVIGSANPVYDNEGRYAGALGLFGDLEPQKRTEAHLRDEIAELRGKIDAAARAKVAPEGASAEREPVLPLALRSAAAIAVCGAYLGVVAMLTAGSVVSSAIGSVRDGDPWGEDSDFENPERGAKRPRVG